MGDNTTQEAISVWDMEVTMTMGGKNIDDVFKDVSYTLEIAKNISFVSKGASLGNVFQFEKNFCIIKNDQKKVVGIGLHNNQFYRLNSTMKLSRLKINQVVVVLERKTYVKVTWIMVCDAHENVKIAKPHVRLGINLWHQCLGHWVLMTWNFLYGKMLWKDSLGDQMRTWPFVKFLFMENNIRSHSQLKELHGLANCEDWCTLTFGD